VIREVTHVAGKNVFALFVQYASGGHPLCDDGILRLNESPSRWVVKTPRRCSSPSGSESVRADAAVYRAFAREHLVCAVRLFLPRKARRVALRQFLLSHQLSEVFAPVLEAFRRAYELRVEHSRLPSRVLHFDMQEMSARRPCDVAR